MSDVLHLIQQTLLIAVALAVLFVLTWNGAGLRAYYKERGWYYEVPWSRWIGKAWRAHRKPPRRRPPTD